MIFEIDGFGLDSKPEITSYGYEGLGDSPESHRWRAQWVGDGVARPCGIMLYAVPVVKHTRCGCWVDPHAYRVSIWPGGEKTWQITSNRKMSMNNARSAWAKPTKDEAIKSLTIRLVRWSNRVSSDVCKIKGAAAAIKLLCPEFSDFAKMAERNVSGLQLNGGDFD